MFRRTAPLAVLAAALLPTLSFAQTTTPAPTPSITSHVDSSTTRNEPLDPERRAQLARRGGGLRIGAWSLGSQSTPTGTSLSTTPSFEGYVRKGLDLHLALENSIGFWRQRQVSASSGGVLGTSGGTTDYYVIPQFTSLLFYPFTKPQQRLEPYVRGGVGLTLGVEDQQGGNGMSMTPGIGVTGGAGVEWRPTEALGLEVSARYQGVKFFQDFAGQQSMQGPVVEGGVTYRFQFR